MNDRANVAAVLALSGRGSLPFESLHRLPLYLHALRSLTASGASEVLVAVDEDQRERVAGEVRRAGVPAEVLGGHGWWRRVGTTATAGLLVHDALCPLASADFLRGVRRDAAGRPNTSLLAFRPVTDTVKTVLDGRIQGTIDREGLAALVSPVVVAPTLLAAAVASDDRPPIDDFTRLATWLRERGEVGLVRAPSLARRVDDASAVNLLECVDELARRVRKEPDGVVAVTGAAGPGTR